MSLIHATQNIFRPSVIFTNSPKQSIAGWRPADFFITLSIPFFLSTSRIRLAVGSGISLLTVKSVAKNKGRRKIRSTAWMAYCDRVNLAISPLFFSYRFRIHALTTAIRMFFPMICESALAIRLSPQTRFAFSSSPAPPSVAGWHRRYLRCSGHGLRPYVPTRRA